MSIDKKRNKNMSKEDTGNKTRKRDEDTKGKEDEEEECCHLMWKPLTLLQIESGRKSHEQHRKSSKYLKWNSITGILEYNLHG